MKYADLHLPYFKQGDDLDHFVRTCATPREALEAHARMLECAAAVLRKVKDIAAGHEIKIEADVHFIRVEGPDDVIDALIAAELVEKSIFDDEEEDEQDRGNG
jgi:hypothetical protein